jgi:tetratricopeptide (TPR) repeat protein
LSSERWQRLRSIYDAVADADANERARLLDSLCADDPSLRAEVEQLLAADSTPNAFLDEGPVPGLSGGLRAGEVLDDRFELIRPLGRGGMGEVWAATDRQLNEPVAIKAVAAAFLDDAEGISRFKREIQLARRVAHPNVCRVHDLVEDRRAGSRVFLTMELVDGETLAAVLAQGEPLPWPEALWIFRQIVAGLSAAHAAGVVHRDLKPANVMLQRGPKEPRVVIMDFGLARAAEPDGQIGLSRTQHPIGTPDYMAPEQITGGVTTPATDVYALGSILFEMLTGEAPFKGGNTLESVMRRARERPRPLHGSVKGVTPRVDAVIARCLAFDAKDRYPTAGQVLEALESSWPQSWHTPGRAVVATGAVAVVAAAGFAAVRFWPSTPTLTPEAQRWYDDAQEGLAEGATVRALNDISRVVNAVPAYAPAHAALAEILLYLDMPGRAQEAMLRSGELAPERGGLPADDKAYIAGIQALLVRDCDTAVGHLRGRATAGTPDRVYRLLTVARALEQCDRPTDADAALKEAAGVDAQNAAVQLRRGRLLARRDEPAALAALAQAETLFRNRANAEGRGDVLATRGGIEADKDRLEAADKTLAAAGDIARALDDTRLRIRVLLWQAVISRKRDDLAAARTLTDEAIALAQREGFETLALDGLFTAGNVQVTRNRFADAEILFGRVLAIADTYRHDAYRARAQLSLASVYLRTLEAERAVAALASARRYFERIGHADNLRVVETLEGQLLMARARFDDAIRHYATALTAARARRDRSQEAAAQENLAYALASAGRYPEALGAYRETARLREALQNVRRVFYARLNVADTLSRLGAFEEAQAMRPPSPAGDTPETEAQYLVIAGSDDYRRSRFAEAARKAGRAVELNARLSPDREIRATALQCLAEAHRGGTDVAATLCARALSDASRTSHTGLRIVATLAATEAATLRRDWATATRLAADAERFMGANPHEDRWRLLALKAAIPAAAGADAASRRAAVARDLDARRLSWGAADFDRWKQRTDVRQLLSGAGLEDGGP